MAALLLAAPLAQGRDGEAVQSDTPTDYSHALPLTVSGKESVVQLRLPREVYLHARSTDLRDLRVFDAAGAVLPYTLQAPAARADSSRRDLPVRVFPVQASPGGRTDADLEVRRSADGSVLSVHASTRQAPAAREELRALVLDLGAAGKAATIDALRLNLPPGAGSYQARVRLEVSDDLKHWDTIGASELAWLVNDRTESLASDRIEFEPRAFRYARLTWQEGKPLQFAAIVAESPLSTDVPAPIERMLVAPAPGRFAHDLVYHAPLAIPVQRIGLELADQSVVLPAQIGRYIELPDPRGAKTTRWEFEPLARATFYQLNQGGKRRSSGDIAITPAHAAQWVLRPESPSVKAPSLRLAWSPSTLVFLASGKPPYRLAFGRGSAKAAQRELAQVAPGFTSAEITTLESAAVGPLQVINPAAADTAGAAQQAAAAARKRMVALWAALLAGVGVLAFMAWRLMKQMK